jgi:ribonuclease HI
VAIFVRNELKEQHEFELYNRFSNNQAKLAIAKALEIIHEIDIAESSPCTIGIFTDSRITIDLLKYVNNNSYLIEVIRKRIYNLERTNWTKEFSWVKAHVGIYGNEQADRLAKAAACSTEMAVNLNRTPKSTLYSEFEEATQKWQNEWLKTTKAAVTK